MGNVGVEGGDIQGHQKDVIGQVVQGFQFQQEISGVLDIGWGGQQQRVDRGGSPKTWIFFQ